MKVRVRRRLGQAFLMWDMKFRERVDNGISGPQRRIPDAEWLDAVVETEQIPVAAAVKLVCDAKGGVSFSLCCTRSEPKMKERKRGHAAKFPGLLTHNDISGIFVPSDMRGSCNQRAFEPP